MKINKISYLFIYVIFFLFLNSCSEPESVVFLNGEWEYCIGFQKKWLIHPDKVNWKKLKLPMNIDFLPEMKGFKGFVTLKKRIPSHILKKFKEGNNIALYSSEVSDICYFYFNDTRFASFGSIDPYKSGNDRILIKDLPSKAVLPNKENNLFIVIFRAGIFDIGVRGPLIELGDSNIIVSRYYQRILISTVLIVFYFIIGFYYLFLGIRRPQELYNLFFGLFCLAFSVFWIANDQIKELVFGSHVLLRFRVDQISLMFIVPLMLLFQSSFFYNKLSKFGIFWLIFNGSIALVDLFASPRIMFILLEIWYFTAIVPFIYLLYDNISQVIKKNKDAMYLSLGLLLLVLSAVHDIMVSLGYFHNIFIAPYVFFVYIIGLALIISNRFVWVHSQLEDLNITLEKKVKQRTRNLKKAIKNLKNTQTQLIQSEKFASIGQLAAGMAHEINNPLGYLKNNSQILSKYLYDLKDNIDHFSFVKQKKDHDFDLTFFLSEIDSIIKENLDGIERIADIVVSLKEFAHVEGSDKFSYIDLNLVINDILSVTRNEYKFLAKIKTDFGDIPKIKCILNEIKQVFINIIINAIQSIVDYQDNNMGIISIKTYQDNKDVVCIIADNGKGIEKKNLNKIFDPFYTTREVGKGTGLGLSICYDIITNKHKGSISVKSHVDKGTTFVIKLPTDNGIE